MLATKIHDLSIVLLEWSSATVGKRDRLANRAVPQNRRSLPSDRFYKEKLHINLVCRLIAVPNHVCVIVEDENW